MLLELYRISFELVSQSVLVNVQVHFIVNCDDPK